MKKRAQRTFSEIEAAIKRKYPFIDSKKRHQQYIILDIIESWEDMCRLFPALDGIVNGKYSGQDVLGPLWELRTWCWHTADHIGRLGRGLRRIDLDIPSNKKSPRHKTKGKRRSQGA